MQVYHALPLYIAAGKLAPKTIHLITDPNWLHCEYVINKRSRKGIEERNKRKK